MMLFPSFTVVVAALVVFAVAAIANWFVWELQGADRSIAHKKEAVRLETRQVRGNLHLAA